jgi:hypothetical protein
VIMGPLSPPSMTPFTCVMLTGLKVSMTSSKALQGGILLQLCTLCHFVKECSASPFCAGLARS